MNNTDNNLTEAQMAEAEIARRKELFEYEMTEVLLNLKGEFSNISKKNMPFDNEPEVPAVTIPDGNISVNIDAANMPKIGETETHGAFFSGLADAAEVNVGVDVPDTSAKVDFTAPELKKVDVSAADTAVKTIAPETVEAVGKSAGKVSISEETKTMLSASEINPAVAVSSAEISAVKLDCSCDTGVKTVKNTLEGLAVDTAVKSKVSVPEASALDALAEIKPAVEVKPVAVPEANVVPGTIAAEDTEISFKIPGIIASAEVVPALAEYKAGSLQSKVKVPEHDFSGMSGIMDVSIDTDSVKAAIVDAVSLSDSDILKVELPEMHYKMSIPEMTEEVPEIRLAKPDFSALEYPEVPEFPDFTSNIDDILSSVLAEQRG
jgi:hypothetical protein